MKASFHGLMFCLAILFAAGGFVTLFESTNDPNSIEMLTVLAVLFVPGRYTWRTGKQFPTKKPELLTDSER